MNLLHRPRESIKGEGDGNQFHSSIHLQLSSSVLCHSSSQFFCRSSIPCPLYHLRFISILFCRRHPSHLLVIHLHLPSIILSPPKPKPRTHFLLCIRILIFRFHIPRFNLIPYSIPLHFPPASLAISLCTGSASRRQQIGFRRDAKKSLRHCHY